MSERKLRHHVGRKKTQQVDVTWEGGGKRNDLGIRWREQGNVTSLAGTDLSEIFQPFSVCQ